MEDLVVLENVHKTWKDFRLGPLTFTIRRGWIHGLIGPNGSGKTSTIKLILDLMRPETGHIRVFGLDPRQDGRAIRQRIGFVFAEHPFYYEELTVDQTARLIRKFYAQWEEHTFQDYLRRFELPLKKKIKHLSKGMKMKLAIALALSHRAELIIMDEPTSGLDPVARRELLDVMQELIQDGTRTVFFSTHITSDLERIADYVTLIFGGRVVFSLTQADIQDRYRLVKGPADALTPEGRSLFLGLHKTPYNFSGLTDDPRQAYAVFQDRVLYDQPTLEDILFYMVKAAPAADPKA